MITKERKRAIIYNFLIIGFIFIVTFAWYKNSRWEVLMGDDVLVIGSFRENGLWGTMFSSENIALGKIRPVSMLLIYLAYLLCGVNYKGYYFLTRVFLAIGVYIIFTLCKKCKIRELYAYAISIFLITCPYSAYGAMQVYGIMEIFSLVCCALCAYYQYRILHCTEKEQIRVNVILCTVIFGLLIFNAERFMYLIAVFILVLLLNQKINLKEKILFCIIYFVPIICRSIMMFMLGASAMGTGRGGILTLLSTLGMYALKGFVNMLGFSLGDQWHGGFTLQELPLFVLAISSLRIIVYIGIGFDAFVKWVSDRKSGTNLTVCIMYLLSLTSLFSYALVGATHGEDRFLWTPYLFYLFALAKYISDYKMQGVYVWKTVFALMLLLASNNYYMDNKDHVHFKYSQEMAQTCIESIRKIDGYERAENICCVGSNDYFWIFGNYLYFDFYLEKEVNVLYCDTLQDIDDGLERENTIVVYPDAEHPVPYGTQARWLSDFAF